VPEPYRLVVLASGSGTTLQALLDAAAEPGSAFAVAAVGSDRDGVPALERATAAGVRTFVCRPDDQPDRATWDAALADAVAAYDPDLLVLAGFMRLVGPTVLDRLRGRCVNTHPSLLPAFPGMHAPRDALAYGVKVAGCTLFVVDSGVDSGPVVAQAAVPVLDDDDEATLHERIKQAERRLLVDVVGRMARSGWTVEGRRVTIP
jgi:phosphoribosylglycinamide formyltransferase-1